MKTLLLASVMTLPLFGLGTCPARAATIANTPNGSAVYTFGYPDTQTYGEVFTAPQSGYLTSFSLSLNGGVGSLVGAVGAWNGVGESANLYTSSARASTGAQTFTFAPNILVVAGQQYVAFLSVYGVPGADRLTSMPTGDNTPGLVGFVFNNTTDPFNNPSWNGSLGGYSDVVFSATVSPALTSVPLPASAPVFGAALLGFAGLGYAAKRRKAAVSA